METISLSLAQLPLPNDINSLLFGPEVLIFLVTVISYLFSFLVYGGYLSAFAGSVGNTPFGFADLSIFDLLAILPMAIITLITKLANAFVSAIVFLTIYFAGPIVLGALARQFLGDIIPDTLASVAFFAGITTWTIAVSIVVLKSFRYIAWQSLVAFLFALFGWYLIFASTTTSGQPPAAAQANVLVDLSTIFFAVTSVIGILMGAFALGNVTAETVVEKGALSKVAQLTLKQMLPSLGRGEEVCANIEPSKKKRWFSRPTIPVSLEPDGYTYCFSAEKPLYLVSSFRNFTLFFLPEESAERKLCGRLISISNNLISATELLVKRRVWEKNKK